jgi:hypothetical protein
VGIKVRQMIDHLQIGAVFPVTMLDLSVAFSDPSKSPLNFQGILITEIQTLSWTQYPSLAARHSMSYSKSSGRNRLFSLVDLHTRNALFEIRGDAVGQRCSCHETRSHLTWLGKPLAVAKVATI